MIFNQNRHSVYWLQMLDKSVQKGFSVIELLLVLSIVLILGAITLFTMSSVKKYAADDQAKRLTDFFDEARQRALNQRKTLRVEINRTKKSVILIDEASGSTATDDFIIKSEPFYSQITIGAMPGGISGAPSSSSSVPVPSFATSDYPLSKGDEKATFRFKPGGKVVDAGTNDIGAGSLVTGATVYVYSTKKSANGNPEITRAVVLIGSSGDSSVYKCVYSAANVCASWIR